ncbi:MAG: hypothetical protein DMF67_08075 [Acidobacteria bacterium]|nr:MAG: hypothetical protein DMF67_08075 [Acidobacteriota bacterium]
MAQAQKKPRPALKKGEAKRVVAATPGFKLKNSAVKVKEVSAAGATPVSVVAEVTEALRFARVEDESAPQTTGVFKQKRWRAVEFRTGDRSWEEFDFLAAPLGAERLEAARHALEELVTEFEAQQNANKGKDDGENEGKQDGDAKGKDESKREGKGKNKNKSKGKSGEPLTRGPLTIKQLNALVSSAVAEVVVEATFRLAKDASGKWRVSEVSVADESSGDLAALWQSVDAQKAARARADLEVVRAALEAFRSERGFYVAAEDSAVLMDHLSPRYIKQIIRLDPWHNPYRYAGTTASYTLASDGADGKPGTADDVTLSR